MDPNAERLVDSLDKSSRTVVFPNRERMIEAARVLMVCHPHHFVVAPDFAPLGIPALVCSPLAVRCLKRNNLYT